uniref:NADAR domain-containing protein n=1 Tax=Meloidogyne enterolobii TaxID=390850 RepID=A0A6V7TRZ1_MELEN|nr:unnamed protein product [Meloidogyne enterolobii]
MIPFYSTTKEYFQFSNFHLVKFNIEGKVYLSTENYYQSSKAEFFNATNEIIAKISNEKPPIAKSLAHQIEINSPLTKIIDWQAVKVNIMKKGLEAKFSQNHELLNLLLLRRIKLLWKPRHQIPSGRWS